MTPFPDNLEWVDATLPLGPHTPVYPGDPPLASEPFLRVDRGDGVNVRKYTLTGHCGTHVDAPLHLFDDGLDVAGLLPEELIGPGWVIGLDTAGAIGLKDLRDALPNGPTPKRILIRTAASKAWHREAFQDFPIPYLSPDAVDFLVDEDVVLVGVDSLSVDPLDAETLVAHERLLEGGAVIVEGLDLSKVEPGPVIVFVAPLKLVGGDGAPARVLLARQKVLKRPKTG